MSSIEAKKIQTDELTNVAGNDIPNNMKPLTPLCYGTLRQSKLEGSFNVSSVTYSGVAATITMISPAATDEYPITLARDGSASLNTYTINYYWSGQTPELRKTANKFVLLAKTDTGTPEWANVGEVSFITFENKEG